MEKTKKKGRQSIINVWYKDDRIADLPGRAIKSHEPLRSDDLWKHPYINHAALPDLPARESRLQWSWNWFKHKFWLNCLNPPWLIHCVVAYISHVIFYIYLCDIKILMQGNMKKKRTDTRLKVKRKCESSAPALVLPAACFAWRRVFGLGLQLQVAASVWAGVSSVSNGLFRAQFLSSARSRRHQTVRNQQPWERERVEPLSGHISGSHTEWMKEICEPSGHGKESRLTPSLRQSAIFLVVCVCCVLYRVSMG